MKRYGLIGFPLSHSFSKKYFTEKFEKEGIHGCVYENYELSKIDHFPKLIESNPDLLGLNVTIPHKQSIMPYLDRLDPAAEKIGAVNVIKFEKDGTLTGHNSDYVGFKNSLLKLLPKEVKGLKALVFGTGGASKAVVVALEDIGIEYTKVSRTKTDGVITYDEITPEFVLSNQVLINTSPLGMSPNTDTCPDIPYEALTNEHYLYDLVYNPLETLFMKKGKDAGAKVSNGLEMLHLQAERAWEIWNS